MREYGQNDVHGASLEAAGSFLRPCLCSCRPISILPPPPPPSPSHHQYKDICPKGVWPVGAASTSPIGAGMTGEWIAFDGPDPQTPSSCADNGWVSVKGYWNRCRSHVQIGHGCPAWGTTSTTLTFRSHVCCMDVVRMSRSAATPPPSPPLTHTHTRPSKHTHNLASPRAVQQRRPHM